MNFKLITKTKTMKKFELINRRDDEENEEVEPDPD
jgi:hypothetical protein